MNHISAGEKIYNLCEEIFPICRSITGDGVRKTFKILNEYIAESGVQIAVSEVASGTQVFDWTVPKEWKIRDAYIEDDQGTKIIDFKENNLHVMGYSAPIDKWVTIDEIEKYIFTQPDQPDWIPFITSYYKEQSGFCMSENQRRSLKPMKYHLFCDSELFDGYLTYGDLIICGESDKEILINSYICHPSMANNECSGPSVLAELIRYVASMEHRAYSYRFVLTPETIGSITYLSQNLEELKKYTEIGFNLTCCGDNRAYYMINTPGANTLADRVMENVLRYRGDYDHISFLRAGSEERRYNAPGIDIPMVCFGRSMYGDYPEYHTSADDMNLVSPEGFQGSYEVMTEVIQALEHNKTYKTTTLCEPQLGKRGLYPSVSQKGMYDEIMPMMNLLSYANGERDLIEISDRIDCPMNRLIPIAEKLETNGLLSLK